MQVDYFSQKYKGGIFFTDTTFIIKTSLQNQCPPFCHHRKALS